MSKVWCTALFTLNETELLLNSGVLLPSLTDLTCFHSLISMCCISRRRDRVHLYYVFCKFRSLVGSIHLNKRVSTKITLAEHYIIVEALLMSTVAPDLCIVTKCSMKLVYFLLLVYNYPWSICMNRLSFDNLLSMFFGSGKVGHCYFPTKSLSLGTGVHTILLVPTNTVSVEFFNQNWVEVLAFLKKYLMTPAIVVALHIFH